MAFAGIRKEKEVADPIACPMPPQARNSGRAARFGYSPAPVEARGR